MVVDHKRQHTLLYRLFDSELDDVLQNKHRAVLKTTKYSAGNQAEIQSSGSLQIIRESGLHIYVLWRLNDSYLTSLTAIVAT